LTAKYIVGIDLGTTNSALARCDALAEGENSPIEVCGIPQLVNPNEVEERTLLPSFLYIPGELDFSRGSIGLPWEVEPQLMKAAVLRDRVIEVLNSWLRQEGFDAPTKTAQGAW